MKLLARFFSVLAIFAFGLAACSTRGGGADSIQIRIENNLLPPTSLSVYAVPEAGTRRLAGIVRPGQTTTLSFSGQGTESYQFVAETTEGREIVSNSVTLGPGTSAVWDVNANLLVPDGR